MEASRIRPVFLWEKRKCAVSKEVTSKPTKAQGARMIRLNTANPLLSPRVPKVWIASVFMAFGMQITVITTTPANRRTAKTV